MSETVKVGRNRPPQNGWASKEEVNELRAEVAELRETNQKMLEEIKGLRAELGGAKRRHLLGAVATSAAAFFGKFFHRGEDLGDFHDKKEHSKGAKKGAHAKGEENEKGGTPIVSARRDEKSKISREQEDKRNKDKRPMWQKAAAVVATVAVAAGVWAFANSPHKGAQDLPKDPSVTEANAGDLRMPETEQALAEQAVEAAEAAHQQQLAETMGMSVEEMHAVADRHGVNYNDIGTAKANDQMRDNMESSYNLSEKIDLENMSEAERSERSKQEILFANMNNKYVTAQISSARLGAHDASDSELTQQLFKQYEENDATWQEHAKENAEFLKASTYSTRLARTSKTYTYGTEGQWDGPIEKQYVTENSGGETVYIAEVTNGDIKMQFKDGCVQAVWVEEVAQPRQQVKERTVVQREVVQKKDQGEWNIEDHGHEEGEENTPSDQKDEHADDSQEREQDKNQESPQSKVGSEMTHDKQQHDKDGAPIVDNKGNMNGTQGDTSEDRPANKNNTEAGNGGSGSGEHITDAGSGNQGGSGKGSTGSNEADSGGSGGKETSQGSQKGGRSWTRDWDSSKGGSWTEDSDGNRTTESHEDSHDTGRVERNGNSNDAANDDVELPSSSVPISQED